MTFALSCLMSMAVSGEALGVSCAIDADCTPPNSHCSTTCVCDSGYKDDGNGACTGQVLGVMLCIQSLYRSIHVCLKHDYIP